MILSTMNATKGMVPFVLHTMCITGISTIVIGILITSKK